MPYMRAIASPIVAQAWTFGATWTWARGCSKQGRTPTSVPMRLRTNRLVRRSQSNLFGWYCMGSMTGSMTEDAIVACSALRLSFAPMTVSLSFEYSGRITSLYGLLETVGKCSALVKPKTPSINSAIDPKINAFMFSLHSFLA